MNVDELADPRTDDWHVLGRHGRSGLLAALLLIFTTVGSHFWMTSLGFQIEDYQQVDEARNLAGPAALLGDQTDDDGTVFITFFRPLVHLSLWLDVRLFGADPRALHLSNVLMHAIAVTLLFFVVRRYVPSRRRSIPVLAALLFSVNPGKWGAVSWVAARGDILMTIGLLASLLFLHRHRRTGGKASAALTVLAIAFALLAKEAALIVPVLVILADLAFLWRGTARPRLGGRLALWLAAIFPAVLILLFRSAKFGDRALTYVGAERTWTPEIFDRMLADLWPAMKDLASGYFYYDESRLPGSLQGPFVTFLALGLAAWIAVSPVKRAALALWVLAAFLAATALPLRFLREGRGVDVSRLFYLPAVFMSLLLAMPCSALFSERRTARAGGLLVGIAILTFWTISGLKDAEAQRAATLFMDDVRAEIGAAAGGLSSTEILLIDLPEDVDYAPAFGRFVKRAFREPFTSPPIDVLRFRSQEKDLLAEHIVGSAKALQLLGWNPAASRLEPRSPLLTPNVPGAALPPSARFLDAASGDARLASIATPERWTGRSAPVVELRLAAPIAGQATYRIEARGKDGGLAVFPIAWSSRFQTDVLRLHLWREVEWPALGEIKTLTVYRDQAATPAPLEARACPVERAIEALAPRNGQELAIDGPEPIFEFACSVDAPLFRLNLTKPMRYSIVAHRDLCRTETPGRYAIRLSTPRADGRPADFLWESGRAGLRTNVLDHFGQKSVELIWSVDALNGDLRWPIEIGGSARAAIVSR